MTSLINLAHVFIIVPILYYIYKNQKELNPSDCKHILYIGIIGFVYHLYKYKEVMDGKEEKWVAYARAVRTLMAETGGLKLSNSSMEDKMTYKKLIRGTAKKQV